MQLEFTAGERAFAEEVDAFFRANLEPRLSEQVRRNPSYVSKEDMRRWQKALYERGWIAPNWPKEHGGTGWTPTQKFICVGVQPVPPCSFGQLGAIQPRS